MSILHEIQQKLKSPKDLENDFGGYSYRSMEGINEQIKPILADLKATLVLSDEMVALNDRIYVKATATLYDDFMKVVAQNTAFARETEIKKGMDAAQITGAASSYARKYACAGLFAIDNTKDPDATNKHGKEERVAPTITSADFEKELDSYESAPEVEAYLKKNLAEIKKMALPEQKKLRAYADQICEVFNKSQGRDKEGLPL